MMKELFLGLLLQGLPLEQRIDLNNDKRPESIYIKTFLDPVYDVRHPESKNGFTTRIRIVDGANKDLVSVFDFRSVSNLYVGIVGGLKKKIPFPRPGLSVLPTVYVLDGYGRTETLQWNGSGYDRCIVKYVKDGLLN